MSKLISLPSRCPLFSMLFSSLPDQLYKTTNACVIQYALMQKQTAKNTKGGCGARWDPGAGRRNRLCAVGANFLREWALESEECGYTDTDHRHEEFDGSSHVLDAKSSLPCAISTLSSLAICADQSAAVDSFTTTEVPLMSTTANTGTASSVSSVETPS